MSSPVPRDASAAEFDALGAKERSSRYERARRSGADATAVGALPTAELARIAEALGIAPATAADHAALCAAVLHRRAKDHGFYWAEGVLEIEPDGFGFLRREEADFAAGETDVYVSGSQIHHLGLRSGHRVAGPARPPRADERHGALLRVETVGGRPLQEHLRRAAFGAGLAVLPHRALELATDGAPLSVQAIARLADLAHGHRILCAFEDPEVPRPTTLAAVAAAAAAADPTLVVQFCLLEAAVEDRARVRAVSPTARIAVATFDEPPVRQLAVLDLSLATAERAAEAGASVLVVVDSLDSILRAGRHQRVRGDHRIHGDRHPASLRVKRAFAVARQLESAGSVTLLASLRDASARELDDDCAALLLRKANTAIAFGADGSRAPDPHRTRTDDLDRFPDVAREGARNALRGRLAAVPPTRRTELWPDLLR